MLRLLRPANIITAWADILCGAVVAGAAQITAYGADGSPLSSYWADLSWLILSTTGLYGGGVVLNDVFDLDIDRTERPERPLPSGKVSVRAASVLGILLLLAGVGAAAMASRQSAVLALGTGALAVVYDAYGKHNRLLGPLNMGACRGGNMLLGMSLFSLQAFPAALALVPVVYIASITLVSRGEVSGSGSRPLFLGMAGYLAVFAIMALAGWWIPGGSKAAIPFLLLFSGVVMPPLGRAIREPSGPRIGRAVRAGVLGLIPMDAALAASFGGWEAGLVILALLPLSLLLARFFAVT